MNASRLFIAIIALCAYSINAHASKLPLSQKFYFKGYITQQSGNTFTTVNFRFSISRNGFIRGSAIKSVSTVKGNTTELTEIKKVCHLTGKIKSGFKNQNNYLRSGLVINTSNGGSIFGNVVFTDSRPKRLKATTPTPELLGLKPHTNHLLFK